MRKDKISRRLRRLDAKSKVELMQKGWLARAEGEGSHFKLGDQSRPPQVDTSISVQRPERGEGEARTVRKEQPSQQEQQVQRPRGRSKSGVLKGQWG